MGYFSELSQELDQGRELPVDTAAFEDEETFDELPVPPSVAPQGQTAFEVDDDLDGMGSEPEKMAEKIEQPSKADDAGKAAADEEDAKRRAEHEAAEAKRKAEWDAKQAEKKKALQEQLDRLAAMSDDDVVAASMQRVSKDTEKLTRRNMKECVSELIQTLCLSDPAFARLTMNPRKSMLHCFQYINRKAWDYIQDELKANGIQLDRNNPGYGCDVPDDLCYQWAEDYFRDPDAKEDQEQEEEFVPKPYAGKTVTGSKPKKPEKKKAEAKSKSAPEKKAATDGQISLLDLAG